MWPRIRTENQPCFPIRYTSKQIYFTRVLFSESVRQEKSEQRQYFTLGWQAAVRGIYGRAAVQCGDQARFVGGTGSWGEATKNPDSDLNPI